MQASEHRFVTITDPLGNYAFTDLPNGIWTIQVEMLCFATEKREVNITAGLPGAEWELTLLPLSAINAEARSQASSKTPSAAPAQSGNLNSAVPAQQRAPLQKGSRDSESEPAARQATGRQDSFQRADLNPSAPNESGVPGAPEREPRAFEGQSADDLAQRASDGLLINGSMNNSASSPFGLFPAFGNFRKGPGSLYNGNLGLIVDNSALDARPFSFTGQNTAKPVYNRLTGVLSFGGPLKIPHVLKNGPNIFVNYQWTRNRDVTTRPGLMPTQAERDGDLSQALNALGQPVRIIDPSTGMKFPGNAIPSSRISPQAKALLSFYPLPNYPGGTRYNYQVSTVGVTHQDSLQSHINKALSRNNHLFGNFYYQSTRTDDPSLFGFLDTTDSSGLDTNLNLRHSFSMRTLVNLGYHYSRAVTRSNPFFADRRNVSGEAGILGNNQDPLNWGPPALIFSGGTTSLSDGRPAFNRNQTSGFSFDMFWGRGRHNLTFGGDFRRQQFNYLSQQDPRGTFTFTGAATQASVNGLPLAGSGSDFADFLLGVPDTSSIAFGNADKYFRASSYDAYVSDDWRINPGLTVNAGIRWEYGSPITELYGRLVNLDIAPGFAAVAPVVAFNPTGALTGQSYPDSLIRPDKRAFQPRAGISWRPFPASSMIIRAGYGVYYNTSVYTTIATQMAQQFPLSKSLSVQNSASNPFTLANGFIGTPAIVANTFAVDPSFRVGYAQNWQISIQRDLPFALVMTATYLGTKGTGGTQQFLPNTYPIGAANPCPLCPTGFAYLTSNGSSSREAGQVQLRRRLRSGIAATLQYVYAKSIDDAALGGRGQGTSVIAQNWLELEAERALSSFDQRHLMNLQVQYTTGMGVGGGALAGGWRGRLLKEWTLTTKITAGSGFPLTPVYLAAVHGTGVTGSIRPARTEASIYAATGGYYLNPAAYTAPAQGKWGNAGRNSIIGPAQFVMNASMGRTFRVKDRFLVDLRVDSANALNHVTFPGWNTTVTSTQFGLPMAANPMRVVQTTLRARF
ncbi:MAG TPA: TonB-dependent receptor [Acidobacteriota bacterium]|nr:TonB-dependent receptor [Acidobacteriota bacterium]